MTQSSPSSPSYCIFLFLTDSGIRRGIQRPGMNMGHACVSVHTDCIHTHIHTYIDIVPSITSIEHHFFFVLDDRYPVLHAWPHLFLSCQSYFPRFFCWPWPLQDILSIPYRLLRTHHTYGGILMRLIQGENEWNIPEYGGCDMSYEWDDDVSSIRILFWHTSFPLSGVFRTFGTFVAPWMWT